MGESGEDLSVSIAGELTVSANPGRSMKLWREKARISQASLARAMGVSPSVLSDYENGRRHSPGAAFLKRFVDSLISLDRQGSRLLTSKPAQVDTSAILGIGEYSEPVTVGRVLEELGAEVLAGRDQLDRLVFGYTVLDSIRTIYSLSGVEFYRIYGKSTERVVVFTQVGLGRSPMVAIRVSQLKPRVVVIHGLRQLDPLAVQLAEKEHLVLAVCSTGSERQIAEKLAALGQTKA
ncbi:MAG TPA: helix-turn-helix domain-containing protein [Conexivisphaerales archaeon]|nr:helix-turn-helix domain-containing protein [Conexivisphaerales archaeon]